VNSKQYKQQQILLRFFLIVSLFFTLHDLLFAEVIRDRVAAFVDNSAITLSELDVKYADTVKVTPGITKEEVLNTMINRELLLKEAKKIRLEGPTEDDVLKEYVDLKIRAFIRIKDEEIMAFFDKHISEFGGKEFDAVRDDIENYLIEEEMNQRLKMHITDLREKNCIKIQLQ